jgi:hypothetical protein
MGRVRGARDELLGRDVAIKEVRLPPGLSEAEKDHLCRRVLREARSAARLSHPAVATVHDVVEDLGRPWIVMELVHGRCLDRLITKDGPLSPVAVAQLGRQYTPIRRKAQHAASLGRRVAAPAPSPGASVPPDRPSPRWSPSSTPSLPASPSSGPFHISGSVSCTSGNAVVGVWVVARKGAGFSPWKGYGNKSAAAFWYTLPQKESYSLHVGCGGTSSSWQVATHSVTVTTAVNIFTCDDVPGQANYRTCHTT